MKKYALLLSISALLISGTYLFAQQGRERQDHRELQEHYNSCTRVINELRDARRTFAVGTSERWSMHKKQVLEDLQRTENSVFQYRQELEKMDEHIIRQDLRPEIR